VGSWTLDQKGSGVVCGTWMSYQPDGDGGAGISTADWKDTSSSGERVRPTRLGGSVEMRDGGPDELSGEAESGKMSLSDESESGRTTLSRMVASSCLTRNGSSILGTKTRGAEDFLQNKDCKSDYRSLTVMLVDEIGFVVGQKDVEEFSDDGILLEKVGVVKDSSNELDLARGCDLVGGVVRQVVEEDLRRVSGLGWKDDFTNFVFSDVTWTSLEIVEEVFVTCSSASTEA
jgi:hypothetical protein